MSQEAGNPRRLLYCLQDKNLWTKARAGVVGQGRDVAPRTKDKLGMCRTRTCGLRRMPAFGA
eukprot:350839-Chlamydomonas_euryale.AAC.2